MTRKLDKRDREIREADRKYKILKAAQKTCEEAHRRIWPDREVPECHALNFEQTLEYFEATFEALKRETFEALKR